MKSKLTLIFKTAFLLFVMQAFKPATTYSQCSSQFFWNPLGITTVVQFINSAQTQGGDSIISYEWNFGDNTTSIDPNPIHTFPAPNQYLVCLKITTQLGCTDSTCQVVNVFPCNITVILTADTVNNSLAVNPQGGSAPYTYMWSNGANTPTITGLSPGTYCCTVTDAMGCSAVGCYTFGQASCAITFYAQSNCNGGVFTFTPNVFGSYDSLVWSFGDNTYANTFIATHQYAAQGSYAVSVSMYVGGLICTQYFQNVFAQALSTSNLCGIVWIDANSNNVYDSTETLLNNQYISIYGSGIQCYTFTDANGYYNLNIPPGTYTLNYCPDSTNIYTQTFPLDSNPYCGYYYNVTVATGQTQCGYNFAVQQNAVTIEGLIFSDLNNNGAYDAGEYGIPNQSVMINNYNIYTNNSGIYTINLPLGSYTINYTPSGPYAPYPLTTPASIAVNATTAGVYGSNNFGLNIPPGSNNLMVILTPYTTVRPGFPAYYHITVSNIGGTPVVPNLTMIYDALLNFNNASPVETTHNLSTHTLTWSLPLLAPGNSTTVLAYFTTSASATLGTVTMELVSVDPATGTDIDLSNNMDTVHQTVVNSWDPNNKLVTRTNTSVSETQIIAPINLDQQIDYVINFQNTGTAPAVNVTVVDKLSGELDETSYQFISSSHSCNTSRNGNEVIYEFCNIMLPDSNSNEPASHGQIKFRINSKTSLVAGQTINDFAKIYFDSNQPVITNTTNVLMINPLGVNENENTFGLNVFPNPVNHQSQLTYQLNENAAVQISLYDAAGKLCATLMNEKQQSGSHTMPLSIKLQNGIYALHFTVNGYSVVRKIVVMQ